MVNRPKEKGVKGRKMGRGSGAWKKNIPEQTGTRQGSRSSIWLHLIRESEIPYVQRTSKPNAEREDEDDEKP
jgi:hypothetical protein